MSARFYISFDTDDMKPNILATRITLDQEVIRDMAKTLSIDLVNHPLYAQLEEYVLMNPSKARQRKV
jgi:hypothetical protein